MYMYLDTSDLNKGKVHLQGIYLFYHFNDNGAGNYLRNFKIHI